MKKCKEKVGKCNRKKKESVCRKIVLGSCPILELPKEKRETS